MAQVRLDERACQVSADQIEAQDRMRERRPSWCTLQGATLARACGGDPRACGCPAVVTRAVRGAWRTWRGPKCVLVECSFHDGGSDCVATRLQLGTGSLWQA